MDMVRKIVRDPLFLSMKSEAATPQDGQVIVDLLDTLNAHKETCAGLAANMIGARKRILAMSDGMVAVAMVNPVILSRSGPYEAEEGCLSLSGVRRVTRYQTIEVAFQDSSFTPRKGTFTGFAAEIIQHEMDHFEGILI